MFHVAVVDDTEQDRKIIDELIRGQSDRYVCHLFSGAFDVSVTAYDAYFLDIDMPFENGISLAKRIRASGSASPVIFISNMEDTVFEALQVQPLRFIRKWRLREEMPEAVLALTKVLEEAEQETAVFDCEEGTVRLSVRRLLYAESFDKRQSLVLPDRTLQCRATMGRLEKLLVPHDFFRIHRCYLVNLHAVYSLKGLTVVMDNGKELPVSRLRQSELTAAVKRVMFS